EGGSCNNYDYTCADPTNALDLDGRKPCRTVSFLAGVFVKFGSFGSACVADGPAPFRSKRDKFNRALRRGTHVSARNPFQSGRVQSVKAVADVASTVAAGAAFGSFLGTFTPCSVVCASGAVAFSSASQAAAGVEAVIECGDGGPLTTCATDPFLFGTGIGVARRAPLGWGYAFDWLTSGV
ncbi:MAG: hypothetical protein AAB263_05130, partial [Planctomycetota bacterium]